MNSLVLQTATQYLLPLLTLFSIFLLAQGHNEPGGGFVGGLVAAAALALYALSHGVAAARRLLRAEPQTLVAVGLLTSLFSSALPVLFDRPFLTGLWGYVPLPGAGPIDLGTPLLFDVGVYLVVVGVTLDVILALLEEA